MTHSLIHRVPCVLTSKEIQPLHTVQRSNTSHHCVWFTPQSQLLVSFLPLLPPMKGDFPNRNLLKHKQMISSPLFKTHQYPITLRKKKIRSLFYQAVNYLELVTYLTPSSPLMFTHWLLWSTYTLFLNVTYAPTLGVCH